MNAIGYIRVIPLNSDEGVRLMRAQLKQLDAMDRLYSKLRPLYEAKKRRQRQAAKIFHKNGS